MTFSCETSPSMHGRSLRGAARNRHFISQARLRMRRFRGLFAMSFSRRALNLEQATSQAEKNPRKTRRRFVSAESRSVHSLSELPCFEHSRGRRLLRAAPVHTPQSRVEGDADPYWCLRIANAAVRPSPDTLDTVAWSWRMTFSMPEAHHRRGQARLRHNV